MFDSTRNEMPAKDYVSVVSSFYKEKFALVTGALVSACAVLTIYLHTGITPILIFAALFILSGAIRYFLILRFEKARISEDDVVAAYRWEMTATVVTVSTALVYGAWCFVCIAFIADPYSQLASAMVSIAVLIGLTSRSFAIDRLVTLSSAAIALPLALALILVGNPYYVVLGILLMPYLLSLRSLAADVRRILLAATRGRHQASRLAEELDMALSTMPHGLCMIDESGKISVVNEQVRASFFLDEAIPFVGRSFVDVMADIRNNGDLTGATADYLESVVAQGGHSKLVISMRNGRQCEVTINSKLGRTVMMMEDITERVQSAERINYMARYDGLTNLANRSFFGEQVVARLREQQALGGRKSVMMMIVNVDDFKDINDTYGHRAGDGILVEIAARLEMVFGPDALVARFGGDEFTIFRTNDVNQKNARRAADAVLAALTEPMRIGNDSICVKASIGIVIAKSLDCELEDLLRRADLALSDAKKKGQCKFSLFKEDMDVAYRTQQKLQADLAEAIRENSLYLLYQPIIDIETGKLSGCEALLRWKHPELGMIPPPDFIAIAEEIGLMADISRWVLEEASRTCAGWPKHMTVSVNLSATDFRHADIEEMIGNALSVSGLAAERLVIEITESALIENIESAEKSLAWVRKKGVEIALDDFGTGYSSLSYLHTLPFTRLKIDRSFVVELDTNERSQLLLRNIANLSADLNLSVTVEGVETEEQMSIIAAIPNIALAQGYLFGAPMPEAEIANLHTQVVPISRVLRTKKTKKISHG